MKCFLEIVAEDLISRFGNNLSGLTIVFPGKRAARFMNNHIARCANAPVWSPRYTTIDDIFQSLSPYTPSDNIRNVCELYEIYSQAVPEPLPLDEFYCWGEILMNDFEDIDKHLVDAKKLFANTADLTQMDKVDFLSDEQIDALRDFFVNFNIGEQTKIKKRFSEMWEAMYGMYCGLRERLSEQGLMYKGALYRMVVEELLRRGDNPFAEGKFAIVGFNVLDDVETALFKAMQESGNALFYWDYDNYYVDGRSEAGAFMRENLRTFPNSLQGDYYNNLMRTPKTIRCVSTNSDNAQVRYLPSWIKKNLTEVENQSVVVLCDESLIQPTLHSIPTSDDKGYRAPKSLNVTMGFPIKGTPIHGYYMALLDLQIFGYDTQSQRFRHSALQRVRSNPFFDGLEPVYQCDGVSLLRWLSERMEALGQMCKSADTPSVFEQLYIESVFQLYCMTNQFLKMMDEGILHVNRNTLYRLVRQASQSINVPFHGDVDEGLQVMGLLETRNLDFSHLIMLSVEEGFMPRDASDTSLIPYCLRNNFHLNTIERKTAVFAYYFYRIIQRAEDITFVYNESSSGATQREQSRFLRQLQAETNLEIEHIRLEPELSQQSTSDVVIVKTEDVMNKLARRFDKRQDAKHDLSPSALGTYLTCPVKFYYQHVVELSVPSETGEGIDNILLGTFFHDSAEFFYSHLVSMKGDNLVCRGDLEKALRQPLSSLSNYIDLVFWVDYFYGDEYDAYLAKGKREAFLQPFLSSSSMEEFNGMVKALYASDKNGLTQSFSGLNMIVRDVVTQYLVQLLNYDKEHTPFQIYGLEQSVHGTIEIEVPGADGNRTVGTGGRIDRMDIVQIDGVETLRIIDYKTGMPKRIPKDIEGIFSKNASGQEHYYLQTFLYCMLMREEQSLPVAPCLFYVTQATDPIAYDPILRIGKERIAAFTDEIADEYSQWLRKLIEEIFNPNEPFRQTESKPDGCSYCDFKKLCGIN